MVKYCERSVFLANEFWDYITDVYRHNLYISEVGLTYHILYDVTKYYDGFAGGTAEVFALRAQFEFRRGADIELDINHSNGQRRNYLLQAKRINAQGHFEISYNRGINIQLDNLRRTGRLEGKTPLYIFYNGESSGLPGSEYGISVVHATQLIQVMRDRFRRGDPCYYLPSNAIHYVTFPWHNLFCTESYRGRRGDKDPSDKDDSTNQPTSFSPDLRFYRQVHPQSGGDDTSQNQSLLSDDVSALPKKRLPRFIVHIKEKV